MAKRLAGRFGYPADDPFKVTLHPLKLMDPGLLVKPRKIFVNSMSDLFHKDVPDSFIAEVFNRMMFFNQHTFIVLTKRAERMQSWVSSHFKFPVPNVWLGVSAENQQYADERIPFLLHTPATVRLVSIEPMLGPVDLMPFLKCEMVKGPEIGYPTGTIHGVDNPPKQYGARLRSSLDWVICGCESGPGARPADIEWAASLMYQCQDAHVPFFFKQWIFGAKEMVKLPLLKGKIWSQFPEAHHA